MKRMCAFVMLILLCSSLVISAEAASYKPKGTDLIMEMDEDSWYVFTRENLKDNPELDEIGITYDYLSDFMQNNYVYMDAITWKENEDYIELIVRKKSLKGVSNLSNHSDKEVMELGAELAEKKENAEYRIYENTYKFVQLEYQDLGYYVNEYVTVVNGENYTFTFQASGRYEDSDYQVMEDIIDDVSFDVDEELENEIEKEVEKERNKSILNGAFGGAIRGAIIGGVVGGIGVLLRKKKSKKNKE